MKTLILLIPVVGAATGWFIVAAMLKLLFWPQNAVKLPFGIYVQGLLPRKRGHLAFSIGEIVEGHLRSAVARDAGIAPDILARLTDTVVDTARERVEAKIPGLVPKGIRNKISSLVEESIRKEIPNFVDGLAHNMSNDSGRGTELCTWLTDSIMRYDLDEARQKMSGSPEILYLKLGAAAVGFSSGLVQLVLVWLAQA